MLSRGQLEEIKINLLRQQADLSHSIAVTSTRFIQNIRSNNIVDDSLFAIPADDNRIITRAVEQLRRINNALNRLELEDAGFGQCEECGEKIPFDRIKLIPTTALCTTCKESREASTAFRMFRRPLSREFMKGIVAV